METLAEAEHGRWNTERLLEGWKLGDEKDVNTKVSPYLVSWVDLPDEVREWDRAAVRSIPDQLASLGFELHKVQGSPL